ncbi:MAG: dTMP kinase [Cyanobacteria bacterium HKST-UBA03]|nr:dTMP kinase [Cyanobacteria bacterium HKST-UBA03]
MFISFEGIDGSGKSTQIGLLQAVLEAEGRSVVVTRDPGGTPLGRELRQILLHHKGEVAPGCELFLYLADRAQHVVTLIRPALAEGKVVLCDRFVDSTVAYQGGGRGMDGGMIDRLNQQATEGLVPDKTILLDGSVETLLGRARSRATATATAKATIPDQTDRFETLDVAFYERVRAQYLNLAKESPARFIVVNAVQPPESVHQDIIRALALNPLPKT